jgi:uncharacterized membrane protein YdjX (TVP38/TMEM64 family)
LVPSTEAQRPRAGRRLPPWVLLLALGLAVAAAWVVLGGDPRQLAAWAEQRGRAGMAIFVVAYASAVVAFVPASVLTLAAGAVYGTAVGVPLVLAGATLGAAAAFLVSRYVARGWVERRLAGVPRFAAIDEAVGSGGFTLVFLLRLSPVVPFTLLNYALGATRVRFRDYVLASVGMLPGSLLYVYSGALAREVASLPAGTGTAPDTARWALLGLGLAATAAATVLVTRAARRALEARIPGAPAPAPRSR